MKIPFRYDKEYQTIEIDIEDMEKLWVSLNLEPAENLSMEEKEKRLMEAVEDQFNRPEYNSWHRSDRNSVQMSVLTKNSNDPNLDDALAVRARGDQGYCTDEDEIRKFEDEEQFKDDCRWVRDVFRSKPHLAEMLIAIRMRCVLIKDYAESIGVDENTVGHRLARVEKKLKKLYEKRPI